MRAVPSAPARAVCRKPDVPFLKLYGPPVHKLDGCCTDHPDRQRTELHRTFIGADGLNSGLRLENADPRLPHDAMGVRRSRRPCPAALASCFSCPFCCPGRWHHIHRPRWRRSGRAGPRYDRPSRGGSTAGWPAVRQGAPHPPTRRYRPRRSGAQRYILGPRALLYDCGSCPTQVKRE